MFFPSKSWCFLNPNTYNVTWSAKQTKTNQKWQHFRGEIVYLRLKFYFVLIQELGFSFLLILMLELKYVTRFFKSQLLLSMGEHGRYLITWRLWAGKVSKMLQKLATMCCCQVKYTIYCLFTRFYVKGLRYFFKTIKQWINGQWSIIQDSMIQLYNI